MKITLIISSLLFASLSFASSEYLIKLQPGMSPEQLQEQLGNAEIEDLEFNNWYKVTTDSVRSMTLSTVRGAEAIEENMVLTYALHQEKIGRDIIDDIIGGIGGGDGGGFPIEDIIGGIGGGNPGGNSKDPDFPKNIPTTTGADPDFSKQWGMQDIGVKQAWQKVSNGAEIVVGVIDTGVDYTHEDLAANIWRNPGESGVDANGKDRATNGIDDDGNGYVDDLVGWDFAKDDNKPYDTTSGGFFGGNPGHGTHCAGNVGAAANNGKGIVGVAPNVKIMALRFLTENGQGDTAGAVKAIKYGVDNGAKILSNSWGSEGDNGDGQALKEVIQYAMDQGVLFVAAAGNSSYNNDKKGREAVPASYNHDNIVSVAALGQGDTLMRFSNYGATTVDLGAPGGKIYSTIPGKYMNLDGTSMACPIVSGAAALYWSKHPNADWREVKDAIMTSAKPISAMSGKSVTGGKLDVLGLMNL